MALSSQIEKFSRDAFMMFAGYSAVRLAVSRRRQWTIRRKNKVAMWTSTGLPSHSCE